MTLRGRRGRDADDDDDDDDDDDKDDAAAAAAAAAAEDVDVVAVVDEEEEEGDGARRSIILVVVGVDAVEEKEEEEVEEEEEEEEEDVDVVEASRSMMCPVCPSCSVASGAHVELCTNASSRCMCFSNPSRTPACRPSSAALRHLGRPQLCLVGLLLPLQPVSQQRVVVAQHAQLPRDLHRERLGMRKVIFSQRDGERNVLHRQLLGALDVPTTTPALDAVAFFFFFFGEGDLLWYNCENKKNCLNGAFHGSVKVL